MRLYTESFDERGGDVFLHATKQAVSERAAPSALPIPRKPPAAPNICTRTHPRSRMLARPSLDPSARLWVCLHAAVCEELGLQNASTQTLHGSCDTDTTHGTSARLPPRRSHGPSTRPPHWEDWSDVRGGSSSGAGPQRRAGVLNSHTAGWWKELQGREAADPPSIVKASVCFSESVAE
ncbi:unnamed protein product [Pleuronectes platessa]|uniref:Uncharacterized protein n=1 Tax=Pleuronectes platessa TaxID=8262 RepID=A0A9N7VTH1_PLEPL|nr:unnamed protein product [Pleuronectes platessa]